ncbi:DNA glycosylase AlkZ-like family protein [Aquihabitans daechungensis]|uniref:DNA glycosylase AlkZ-like family protein n=1 Tax=Aquihabitans daechungensis TaxID=1052257 RepID=UPI003BA110FC
MATPTVDRRQVLAFRTRRHQLGNHRAAKVDLLDYGIQDTGPDGAAWALAVRGGTTPPKDLALAWTLRGAPHAYRRSTLAKVAVATAPYDEADAAKRMFDASKPLKAAGIDALTALRTVAAELRKLAAEPIVKGDASGALNEVLDDPYLRSCRPCKAIHIYEMPFRLAALQAGLELEAGTSPPVLRRVPKLAPADYEHAGSEASPRFDVIRNHLRFYGPATIKDLSEFIDMPVAVAKAHWPEDAVEVTVSDAAKARRFVLEADLADLQAAAPRRSATVSMLGPYDPYLQLRGRDTLVTEPARRKQLWPVLGRPGAFVVDGEIVATWRPKTASKKLTIRLEPWTELSAKVRRGIDEQAAALADHRGVELAGVVDESS